MKILYAKFELSPLTRKRENFQHRSDERTFLQFVESVLVHLKGLLKFRSLEGQKFDAM